jgi:hypothetical protein
MQRIFRYPRTQHVIGSKLGPGDDNLKQIPFSQLVGRQLVIEEKVDGANSGISYGSDWLQLLQSRGHYLTGGPRERHFNLFKQWANLHSEALLEVLTDRYILYGEWMYAKHTVFYNRLKHYFNEFDILDTQEGTYIDGEGNENPGSWLSTARRREMLKGIPVEPVLVLFEGKLDSFEQLQDLIGPSHFKSEDCWDFFLDYHPQFDDNSDRVEKGTDQTNLMEGLYIKVEEDGVVKERYKLVRPEFTQKIVDSDEHWLSRPIIPNVLEDGIDIFKL